MFCHHHHHPHPLIFSLRKMILIILIQYQRHGIFILIERSNIKLSLFNFLLRSYLLKHSKSSCRPNTQLRLRSVVNPLHQHFLLHHNYQKPLHQDLKGINLILHGINLILHQHLLYLLMAKQS